MGFGVGAGVGVRVRVRLRVEVGVRGPAEDQVALEQVLVERVNARADARVRIAPPAGDHVVSPISRLYLAYISPPAGDHVEGVADQVVLGPG